MGASDQDAALAVVTATSVPIHDIGTAIYLSPDVFGWAAEWGWSNPFAFYFAGARRHARRRRRGRRDVRVRMVRAQRRAGPCTTKASAVAGAREAAARMAEAHAKWGEKHYADVDGLDGIVAVTEELVDGLEGSAIPLFVGWRDADRSATAAGRAAQLMQILREWRGGLHLVATTAVGLSPVEAILTNEGPGQAKFFGWSEPFAGRQQHQGQARRGRGDHRPPLRDGAGRGPRRRPGTPPSSPASARSAPPRPRCSGGPGGPGPARGSDRLQ